VNRDQAYALIRQTFTQGFDKARFGNLAINLLNCLDESKAQSWNSQYVKHAFNDHVQRYERLGTYSSPDNEKLDVLIVHLTRESKLERARTAIRNFVADHLKTRDEKDAALVAFVSPTEKQWRFSYVKMEYATVEKESGKVGVETRLTPARRFSYIVGEGESCHTAQTRFLGLLQDTQTDPKLADIEEVFSVEAVTKEFFKQYANLFGDIHKALEKIVEKDRTIRDEFQAKNVSTVDFSKKLMGQIVFLYFLQKKGWLGVAKGQDWGSGPHDFLRRLEKTEYGKYDNFFNDILEPLFYDTLATDRDHEAWCNRFKCRIPFLNGGLFEPLGGYNWKKADILMPNRLFTNTDFVEEGITGTGVLDVFDRYNFTVNEAEPMEKEVAIDPEMLGKVFENLIEDNRRKGLGAYYTPREIVHYMCQESLINYLDTVLNKEKELVLRKDIETFVHLGDQAAFYEAARMSGTKSYKPELPRSIETHARLIDEKLADITVCDPAVGSGAFPVGMMTEIVRARSALTPYFNDVHERTPYFFKRHAIQNCLYGVDIDPGAVEIAKLRLWLSLVVDEEDVKQVKPLPNLDYKVVAGNSLLGVEQTLENWKAFAELENLKPQYFDETDAKKKAALKQKIDDLIHQLTNGKEIFDFEIYFSEVFHRKGGFDVVIANPPYIGESGHKDLFRRTKQGRLGQFYMGKMDYFYFFLHLALNMTSERGKVTFITTNYYPTATGARKLRADFKQRSSVLQLINFNELRIFESAQGQHNMLTLLRKGYEQARLARTCVSNRTGLSTPNILMRILGWADEESKYFSIPQQELYDGTENYIRLNREQADKSGHKPTINGVLDKIARQEDLLGRIVHINQGVVSGCDYVSSRNQQKLPKSCDVAYGDGIFVFDLENPHDKQVVANFTESEKHLLRRFYKNSDIFRYFCSNRTSKRLLYIGRNLDSLHDFPHVAAHMKKLRPILTDRREVENGRIEFFQLQWPRTEDIFISDKIVVPYRSKENAFAYNDTEWFCRSDCYVITKKNSAYSLKYLLALLNSMLYFQWLYHRGKRKGEMLEMFQVPLSEIPVKSIDKNAQKPFINFVDQILSAKKRDPKADTAALEREIDRLVYELYGLTEEEIAIVEGTAK
jgi:type I restriction-modification system DNA methylase subunit